MGLRDDPGQQLIAVFVPREASRLLARANSQGWSRAELLRRMIKDFLHAAERGNT
jgi:hypothetical protein